MEPIELAIPQEYFRWIEKLYHEIYPGGLFQLKTSQVGQQILAKSPEEQAAIVLAMLRWLRQQEIAIQAILQQATPDSLIGRDFEIDPFYILLAINVLLEQNILLTEAEVIEILTSNLDLETAYPLQLKPICKVVTNYLQKYPLTPDLKSVLKQFCDHAEGAYYYRKEVNKLIPELRKALTPDTDIYLPIVAGEAWADVALQEIQTLAKPQQGVWAKLLSLCLQGTDSKPSSKWLKSAELLLSELGVDRFRSAVLTWFPLVDKPRTEPIQSWNQWLPDPNPLLNDRNADILKGFVWICARTADGELARALANLAVSAYRKAPGVGPRCVRLGNACVWALGQMPGEDAVAQLALLKIKIKFGTAQKEVEKALNAAAARMGLPAAEIEEMAVPAYGLETVGIRREQLGEFTAELIVTGTNAVELRWLKADGQPQKSVPKAVKDHHAEDLKELNQTVKDIQKMLPAQRDRIESLYLQGKTWTLVNWQARYLNHPLVGTLARRMIWQFTEGKNSSSGIWQSDHLVNQHGQPLDWLTANTQVELWHPITASTETILTWRNWLVENQIPQPFKQAHREIYLLTDAERQTETYSNRFAAHILKQHQFNALCGQRGWKNKLRLMVDDTYPPATLFMPAWGLRAEFWVEGIGSNYGVDTTDAGTYLYLATDQVRFYPLSVGENSTHAYGGGYGGAAGEPTPLAEIPALVLTEVLRDVDLFVGVASVGNDPNWTDGGPEGRYRDYWYDYSFGELSETAKVRQQLLQRLIPRLKIVDRCEFQDKFLVVRGQFRTYKIHLGSGNILMEPNNQYLCIVPDRSLQTSNPVFLPFEGDTTLSLILSKAFLLADDTNIKDRSILSQIR